MYNSFIAEAFETTISEFDKIDIVVNNAEIMNDKFWELEVDVNLVSAELWPFRNTIFVKLCSFIHYYTERSDPWNDVSPEVHGQELQDGSRWNRPEHRLIRQHPPSDLHSHLHSNETCHSWINQIVRSKRCIFYTIS